MKPQHPIRAYRTAKKQSLRALAAELGIEAMTISRWERGVRMPRPKYWPRIAVITGVTPAELAAFKAGAAK